MLVSLRDVVSTQNKSTENTYEDVVWLLNYAASHPISTIQYKASDMVFQIHTDASYLSVSRDHIQSGGHHYLSNNSDDPPNNGAINAIFKIMENVVGSAAKAKIGSTYINAQDDIPL